MRTIIIKKSRYFAAIGVLCIGLLAVTSSMARDFHVYQVEIDASLSHLKIVATFSEAVVDIAARSRNAPDFLLDAHDCADGASIKTRGHRMITPSAGIRCLRYTVDLHRAAQAEPRNLLLHASNFIVSPTVWMWRPRLGGNDEIHVRFRLPDGVQVSVPWRPIELADNTYQLTPSPQSGSAITIFGQFGSSVAIVAGAKLRVDLLRSREDIDVAPIVDWIREAANNITLAYGRFPNPSARIVVFPMGGRLWRSDSPVFFGRVVRDGGETVELLIDPAQPMDSFYDDWTATHELSHMMLPYLRTGQRWLSEGFAQYYQNVLLARAGRYTQRDAWQKLFDGFERGRSSVPYLSPNQAARGDERNRRMKIYWSGAALALMADVELRKRSNGAESLDAVLSQFQRCCLPSQRAWSGKELFKKFDSFLDEPLFMNLYRRYADAAGFPDVRPLLERLGITVERGEVQLSGEAELVEIRAALTAPRYTDAPGR